MPRQLTTRFIWLPTLWLLLITVLVNSTTPSAYAELNLELPDLNLPEIGTSTATISQDTALGLKIVRNYRKHLPVVEDPELNSWLQSIGRQLANKAPTHGKLYFLLVKNPEINAFATPGGVIVINTGLILHSDSESELAAVMAHEIAHITQNHIARRIADAKSNVLGTSAAILAGLAASSRSPDAASAIISTTIAAQQHNQLAFSREMEAEADRVGIRILNYSGFKASGMPGFMEKLDRLNDNPNAQLTKYLLSHPLSIERLSDTRSRAQRLGNRGRDDISFFYAREKIRGLMSTGLQAQTPSLPNQRITRYSQAIKLISRGKNNAALQLLEKKNNNAHLAETLATAQALNNTRQHQKAISLLQPLAIARPGEQAILVPLANALLATGKAQDAWNVLKAVVPSEQTSLNFFEIKQEAAKEMGYIADAYIASAERNIRMGESRLAISQLQQAIKLQTVSAQDISRLQSKLNRIQQQ